MRKHSFVEIILLILGLGLGAFLCVYWEPVAQYLTEGGNGEPIAMLLGVSVWPSVLLRCLGIILAFYFIWRARRMLRNNLEDIASEMRLPSWKQITNGPKDNHLLRKKITHLFDFSLQSDQAFQSMHRLQVEAIWQAYVCQERFWGRILRTTLYTSIMFQILRYVLVPLFGITPVPVRGALAGKFYYAVTAYEALLILFVTFFVFDATLFCLLFVKKLRRAQTEWPFETMEVYEERLRLQSELVNDADAALSLGRSASLCLRNIDPTDCGFIQPVDINELRDLANPELPKVIEKPYPTFDDRNTGCIAKLIYYPLGLIALFILAGSNVFANYAPSLTLLVSHGISFTIVIGCAIVLWRESEALRARAKENLTDAINYMKVEFDCASVKDAISDLEKMGLRNKIRLKAQLEALLSKVNKLNEGAFNSISQQPLVKAVLLPLL